MDFTRQDSLSAGTFRRRRLDCESRSDPAVHSMYDKHASAKLRAILTTSHHCTAYIHSVFI